MSPARFPVPAAFPRSTAILLTAILLLAAVPAAARPLAALDLSNGSQPIGQLLVGDDLYAAVSQAPPDSPFELRLYAPDGVQLAAEMGQTDAAGNTPPVLLWVRTGVVGCNPCLPADPTLWRFQNFAQAEAALAGQTLTVEVADPFSQQVWASLAVTVAAPAQEIAYFSGPNGCPREQFTAGKPIYLTLWHPNLLAPQRRLFLPAAAPAWLLGQPIADARGALQVIGLPPATPGAANQLTFLVTGTSGLAPGLYDGLFRFQAIDTPLVLSGDLRVAGRYLCGEGRIRGGIMITLDDCTNCLPPG